MGRFFKRSQPPQGMAKDDLVVVEVVSTEPEAELLCGLLRSGGIKCLHKLTNRGAGAADGWGVGGPRQVMVRQKDADSARKILRRSANLRRTTTFM